ncbi:phenylacetate-CoA oxygenase subunit PaaJ [Cryomorpha ignava]|uniref:Phenylacetate-CoA oxygenase subunit PaaJ n=1 Tax=Cryomorpha ignava TaxID=101383 RepID=A0A7K3WT14_9FLAO|nr:1,2-phenylacetyl-CoA epoxidase subunit PaaD [Cryomorpha ignava]NEN24833.1 phenylacetate-CoA oxygenase subunit PaaJ [Cryomorpha ignava]
MDEKKIYEILESVKDPEIPVLSIADLGILRNVEISEEGKLIVTITPTYSGCPAMDTIEKDILKALNSEGYDAEIKTSISPAWTTDWLTKKGRKNLEEYGIAPPAESTTDKSFLTGSHKELRCPQCKSTDTEMISHFGSTACKALYKCKDCLEPFDYFKCI